MYRIWEKLSMPTKQSSGATDKISYNYSMVGFANAGGHITRPRIAEYRRVSIYLALEVEPSQMTAAAHASKPTRTADT